MNSDTVFCITCGQALENKYSHPVWYGNQDDAWEWCNGPYVYAPIPEPLTDGQWEVLFESEVTQ